MSVCEDIKTLLTGITTNIKIDDMPDTPDALMCLYHTGGYDPEYEMGQQLPTFEYPTIQVRIRHTYTATALQWANSVKNTLSGLTESTINGTRYISIMQQGDILQLGKDDKNRAKYSLNFRCQIQR